MTGSGSGVGSGPLSGLDVLDLSWGTAGPMTSMLLADCGARVTRIESPHGDPVRDDVAYRVWNRGKRSAVLDLAAEADRDVFLALAARADVVLESFEPGVTARLGIDEPTLRELNPRLVYCSITGYGPGGPDAHRVAYDSLVAARTGLQWDQRGWTGTSFGRISGAPVPAAGIDVPALPASRFDQPGPVFLRSTWPSIGATFLATVGISAALRAREVTGRGDHVRTSLLQGAMAVAGPTWQRAEHPDAPGFWMWVLDRRAPEGLFECADGRWVHFWTIRPTVVLEAAEHEELPIEGDPDATDDMSAGVRIGMEPDDLVILYHYHPLLVEAFRKFPSDRWVAFGAARGLGIALVRSPEEALADDALLDHGCVVEVDDPEVGPIRHAGVLIEFSDTPGRVQGPARPVGADTDEVRNEARSRPRHRRAHDDVGGENAGPAPLAGVTVLDLGLGVAGPWGGRVLADLGADVIKVHALHDGYWARTHMGLATNWGKRSIAVNLKDPRGREVLDRLIARADVLAHNMRPGAAERLGIGYDELHVRFPRLVYCHTRGFEDGPRSRLPGTDQTANALAGAEYEDGACHLGGPPTWSRINTGDTGNGYLWAAAVIQALYHRDRTGQGQKVGTAIVNACLLTTSYAYSRADGTPVARPRIDRDQKGLSALHGLYELADGEWLCVAALTDDHWRGLCDALGGAGLSDDDRFATAASRVEHDAALRELLAARFARLPADEAVRALDKHEVPAEISSTTFPIELFDDPEIARRGWIAAGDVPGVGRLEQPGVLVDLAVHPGGVSRPPCLAGQHTAEILAELGYDAPSIAALTDATVVLASTD